MENKKNVVCRDNIYVGEVVRTNRIYRYEGEHDLFRTKPGQLSTGPWISYRSMLFVPNEERLSDDLLYKSPSYPILNVTDDETCLNLNEGSIFVKDACNLAALLEYFGYDKELTYRDIVQIRKQFFTGRFGKDNCELFGYKEIMPEDCKYFRDGIEITDPRELKRRIAQARKTQQAGHRMFVGISESVLPREYWDTLDEMGDKDLKHAIEWHEKMNAFKPAKEEGLIRKLRR